MVFKVVATEGYLVEQPGQTRQVCGVKQDLPRARISLVGSVHPVKTE